MEWPGCHAGHDGPDLHCRFSHSLKCPAVDADASAFREFWIHGWKVVDKTARITAFKQEDYFVDPEDSTGNSSVSAGVTRLQPGVIFTIEIQRSTT